MARKKIREYDAKQIILQNILQNCFTLAIKLVAITPETNLASLPEQHPWLLSTNLVVKPDQLFGKRGKYGLVLANKSFEEVKQFITEHQHKQVTIDKATDTLTHFIIEPFIPHDKEYYLAIKSERDHDTIHFSETGGINIEENWDAVKTVYVPTLSELTTDNLSQLTTNPTIQSFIKEALSQFRTLDFTYLEFNPFTIQEATNTIYLLDTVAEIDSCSLFKNHISPELPKEFGKQPFPEEEYIENLDRNSGASLKLSVLNQQGTIWNVLGGGGASIIYLDMIANLGKGDQIANYGESSGNPSTQESYEYAKSIISMMLKNNGKILFIVGGIANFTDVKDTFKGFIQAIEEHAQQLKEQNIKIFVRRGGPNYEQGLRQIKETVTNLQIPIEVHGPETSMPKIIQIAESDLS